MSSISYAITVCNEVQELEYLLDNLKPYVRQEIDEIVILQDTSKGDEIAQEIQSVIRKHNLLSTTFTGTFSGNFADWKNKLNAYCTKDYIFQIDADEFLSPNLGKFLPRVLECNPDVDLFWVPRANKVEGITAEDIRRWNWRVTEMGGYGLINWPDYQSRIYRNSPKLQWEGKVHERITGYQKYTKLPDLMFLHHIKGIQKQREQNALYSQMVYGK